MKDRAQTGGCPAVVTDRSRLVPGGKVRHDARRTPDHPGRVGVRVARSGAPRPHGVRRRRPGGSGRAGSWRVRRRLRGRIGRSARDHGPVIGSPVSGLGSGSFAVEQAHQNQPITRIFATPSFRWRLIDPRPGWTVVVPRCCWRLFPAFLGGCVQSRSGGASEISSGREFL